MIDGEVASPHTSRRTELKIDGILLLSLAQVLSMTAWGIPPSKVKAAALTAGSTKPRYVFAHYMVCFATYGETMEGYRREILEAQSANIDGFALNVGAWDDVQPYYKRRVKLMYDAAEQLDSGFKLFFSVDFDGSSNIVDMIQTYAARPNSFRYQDK